MVYLHKARITAMFSISIVATASFLHASKHKGHSSYPQKKAELRRVQLGKPPLTVVADIRAAEVLTALTYPQVHYWGLLSNNW